MSKLCKYGCGKMLDWDTAISAFKESEGNKEVHTRERCTAFKTLAQVQSEQQSKPAAVAQQKQAQSTLTTNGNGGDNKSAEIKAMQDRRVEVENRQTEAMNFLASTVQDLNKTLKQLLSIYAQQQGVALE